MSRKTASNHLRLLLALALAAACAASAAIAATAAPSCSAPSFTLQPIYAVGTDPRSIAAADFDGDGRADLAVSVESGVAVMLGDGTGGFGTAAKFGTIAGAASTGIVIADFNRDSKPDVAVLGPAGATVFVLPGDGAGGLGASVTTTIGSDDSPEVLGGSADFNGDGNPDLIVVNRIGGPNNSGSIYVLLGNGAGGFSSPTKISVGTSVNAGAVGIADFNGDGKPDLAVPAGNAFSILLGNGAGGFGPPTSFANASAQYLTVADFNGDGRADLALVNISVNSVSVVLGDGAGGFGAAASFNLAAKGPQGITAADFNGDGRADLAVANIGPPSPSVSVLFGDGAGGFGPAANFAAPQNPSGITAADFNGDGLTDLVTSNNIANNVSVMLDTCGAATGDSPAVQFSAPNYNVGEGAGSVTVTVTRTGSLAGAASVRYATSDGAASERSDYIAAYGTLSFAPGEGAKSFKVLVIDDARALEGNESFNLTLSDAAGATLGSTSSATVTIQDNDLTLTTANPIDTPSFFVRQHYYDFLNREPDDAGLQFWTQGITSCGSDANCIEVKRINTSAAFFLSIEFQETGYLVYRFYKVAYGDATSPNVEGTVPIVRLREFLGDTQEIGQGVEVGIGDWQQRLEANKGAFAQEFIKRQRFLDAYPLTMTDDAFVDKLNRNSGGVLTQAERDQLVTRLAQSDTLATRGDVLRQVAENSALKAKESNRAFVLMQFFGYLRRNPDDAPDADFRGWKFWLDKLDQFGGDFVRAEMVKAFLVSAEYRQRFNGPDGL